MYDFNPQICPHVAKSCIKRLHGFAFIFVRALRKIYITCIAYFVLTNTTGNFNTGRVWPIPTLTTIPKASIGPTVTPLETSRQVYVIIPWS